MYDHLFSNFHRKQLQRKWEKVKMIDFTEYCVNFAMLSSEHLGAISTLTDDI